jgi:hypothetical protein
MGTHNHLLQLGDAVYLEIVAVDRRSERPPRARWFGLDDAQRVAADWAAGRRLRGWVASTDAIDRVLARIARRIFGAKVSLPWREPTFEFALARRRRAAAGRGRAVRHRPARPGRARWRDRRPRRAPCTTSRSRIPIRTASRALYDELASTATDDRSGRGHPLSGAAGDARRPAGAVLDVFQRGGPQMTRASTRSGERPRVWQQNDC